MDTPAPARRIVPDLLVMALGAVVLVGASLHSTRVARFWTDECLTVYVVEIESPRAMLAACSDTINAAPPLYFLLAWGWVQAFGPGVLALRLFTAIAFALAFALVYGSLARGWSRQAAAVGAFTALLGCTAFVQHDLEARFYGLWFLEIAAGCWWLVRDVSRPRTTPGSLVLWLAIHAALVTTHYFGFVYSAALLAATALVHLRDRRRLVTTVLAGLAGWLAFVPWIPSFERHSEFGGDGFWVPRPYLSDALAAFDLIEQPGLIALVVGATAIAATRIARRARGLAAGLADVDRPLLASEIVRARTAWLAIALAFACVPPGTFVASRLGTSLFLERYFFPSTLAFAVLIAWTWNRIATLPGARRVALLGATTLVGLSFFVAFRHSDHRRDAEWPFELRGETTPGPFVLEGTRFLPLAHYAAADDEMLFIQDRALAFDPATAKRAMNSYQILAGLARHVPGVRTITTEELFARYERFVVVDLPTHPWFEARVLDDPRWSARRIEGEPARWEVRRVRPADAPPTRAGD